MRSRALLALVALIAIPALAQTPVPAGAKRDAEAFVRATYRRYDVRSAAGPDFTGRNAGGVFTPALVLLIRRDQRQARGEVGKLDGDPICDCQDLDGLKLTAVQITEATDHAATAAVTLTFPPNEVTHIRLRLVLLPQGWRIDDVETKDTPSLRKLLQ